jgi:alanyl-tRNA synthetase
LVQAQGEALQGAEKARRRLATEVASFRGRELYAATAPDAGGTRRVVQRLRKGAIDDELRATAQSFTAQPKAVFLAVIEEPPAVLLAASKDAGINAGEVLKAALGRVGGRGGGSAVLAQGSAPSREPLEAVIKELQG